MSWLSKIIDKLFLTKEIADQDGVVHFRRWCCFVLPRIRVYIHRISLPDYDKHRHSHPWNFFSWILKGSYTETYVSAPDYEEVKTEERKPFSLAHRNRNDFHRIEEMNGPIWTMVFTYGKYKTWGYKLWSSQDQAYLAWMDHVTYRKEKRAGLFNEMDNNGLPIIRGRRLPGPGLMDIPTNPQIHFPQKFSTKLAKLMWGK